MAHVTNTFALEILSSHGIELAPDQPKSHTKLTCGHQRIYLIGGNLEPKEGEPHTFTRIDTTTPVEGMTPPTRKNGNIAVAQKMSAYSSKDEVKAALELLAECVKANADVPMSAKGWGAGGKKVVLC